MIPPAVILCSTDRRNHITGRVILFCHKCSLDILILCAIFNDKQIINIESGILHNGNTSFSTLVAAVAKQVYRFGRVHLLLCHLVHGSLCGRVLDFL